MLRREPPAVVVADSGLGAAEQIALCRATRAGDPCAAVPVVVLAALPPGGYEHAGLIDAGARTVLPEPVDPAVLVAALRAALAVAEVPRERLAALREHHASPAALAEARAPQSMAGETRALLRLLEREAGAGVFEWSRAGGRVSWSEALEKLYGLAPGTFGGTLAAWGRFLSHDHHALVCAELRAAVDARAPRASLAFTARRADGAVRRLNAVVELRYDAAGDLERAFGVNTDVTARRHDEAPASPGRDAALPPPETTDARARDEFLAMLGHELRNPLAAVHGAVLTASLDPTRAARALDIARRQAEQLSRIVDDLLDVARITQGRVALRRERVDLRRLVTRALETSRLLVDSRHHVLAVHVPPLAVEVEVDPGRLEQVVAHLVGNAAKFTEPGGRIDVILVAEGADAVLRVRDTGVGIPGDLLPRVFELFAQGDRSLDRSHGGLGIGLTVARRLVELHGGRIDAASGGADLGAEFVVRLPLAPAAEGGRVAEGIPEGPGRRRILVVEDNFDAAESMQMLLQFLGHDVRVAYDGVSAVAVAQAERPDLMLIDIGLPGIDGYEVARRVRRHPAFAHVRLVAVTGYGREEDRQHAMAAGFDDHLVKPVDLDVLRSALAVATRRPDGDDARTPAAG